MRFASYTRDGGLRHGRLRDDGRSIDELGDGDLLVLLEGPGLQDPPAPTGSYDLSAVRLTAPIPRPPKLLAVAANYASHVVNSGGTPVNPARATPRLFLKPSSAVAAHDADLELPALGRDIDWEVELAVVIGRRCRDVPAERALDVVAGYMTANDVSARSFDFGIERDESSIHPFFDWLAGKWLDGFAPFGPWLVSADEVGDPGDLELHLDVNGLVHQHGTTAELIFDIPAIIAYASSLMTLEPGDVIETGTTGGAGVETGVYVQAGDVMTARVGDLGEIRTTVVDRRA